MKTTEQRFWHNGYHKREWGCEFCLGSVRLGYGLVLWVGRTGWVRFNIYKIIK